MSYRLDLIGEIANKKRTPQGGLQLRANLTRTGVFTYHNADGSFLRELRPAAEVFAPESLATLAGVPLTIGHPSGSVTADNWKDLAVGHVSDDVHKDGQFVASGVRVQDKSAVKGVEDKSLRELSCGYDCDIEFSTGVCDGEEYDAIQRNIRYNHVGLGPTGWGRAGSDVRLHIDGGYTLDMMSKVSHADNATAAPVTAPVVAPVVPVAPAITLADLDTARKDADTAKGANAVLTAKVTELTAALAVANDPKRLDGLVAARFTLQDSARTVLGAEHKFDGQTDEEIKRAVVAKVSPTVKIDNVAALEGAFAVALAHVDAAPNAALAALHTDSITAVTTTDGADEDPAEKMAQRNKNAWKTWK